MALGQFFQNIGTQLGNFGRNVGTQLGGVMQDPETRERLLRQIQAAGMQGNYMENLTALEEQARQATLEKRDQEMAEQYQEWQMRQQEMQEERLRMAMEAEAAYREAQIKQQQEEAKLSQERLRVDQERLRNEQARIKQEEARIKAYESGQMSLKRTREAKWRKIPKTEAQMQNLDDPENTAYEQNTLTGETRPIGRGAKPMDPMDMLMLQVMGNMGIMPGGALGGQMQPGQLGSPMGPGTGPMAPQRGPVMPNPYDQFLPRP